MNHPVYNTSLSVKENYLFLLRFYNERAIYHLGRKTNFHENIHQARLCCKRQRSILRLFRFALGESHYKSLNEFYRDKSRQLSPLRDLTANMETCDLLLGRTKKDDAVKYLCKIKNLFIRERNSILQSATFKKVKSDVMADFHQMGNKLLQTDIVNKEGDKVLGRGITAIICRARKEFKVNADSIDPHSMHQWRKRVKYLGYQLNIITPFWPSIVGAFSAEIQVLAKLLGKHHDLFMLETHLKQIKNESGSKKEASFILRKLYRERTAIEKKSLQLGTRMFGIINCKDVGGWFGRLSNII
jgi:CHAD domain-containing protein